MLVVSELLIVSVMLVCVLYVLYWMHIRERLDGRPGLNGICGRLMDAIAAYDQPSGVQTAGPLNGRGPREIVAVRQNDGKWAARLPVDVKENECLVVRTMVDVLPVQQSASSLTKATRHSGMSGASGRSHRHRRHKGSCRHSQREHNRRRQSTGTLTAPAAFKSVSCVAVGDTPVAARTRSGGTKSARQRSATTAALNNDKDHAQTVNI